LGHSVDIMGIKMFELVDWFLITTFTRIIFIGGISKQDLL